MLPVALMDLAEAQAPQGWLTTPGIVEASGVRTTSSSSGRLGVDDFHVPDVRYRYQVEGKLFRNNTVYLGKGPNGEQDARAAAARYSVGAAVTVYYNARDPAHAVLDTDVHAKNYHAVLATILGLVAGLACLLRFWRLRRSELGLAAAPAPVLAPKRRSRLRSAAKRADRHDV
ncbi:MAG: DUF3592 domain-containing protein [Beijerinckiaceae bacterium]